MMRKLFALALACAVCAGTASAAALKWTDSEGNLTTSELTYNSTLTGKSTSSTFSVLLTVTVGTLPANTNWNIIEVYGSDDTEGFKVRVEGSQWMLLKYKDGGNDIDLNNGSSNNLYTNLNTAPGELRVAISVDGTSIHAAVTDGTAIYTNTQAIDFDTLDSWKIGTSVSGFTIDELAVFDGVAWTDEQLKAAVLPEPTALALLALGVAGLALRRRAR